MHEEPVFRGSSSPQKARNPHCWWVSLSRPKQGQFRCPPTAPYSYRFSPSTGTALPTMASADYSRQALLRVPRWAHVRESSSGKNVFFPTMCLLHLHLGFRVAWGFVLSCRLTHPRMPDAVPVRQASGLPPTSFRFRLATDTLVFGYALGATPRARDFHPLERAHAERTSSRW